LLGSFSGEDKILTIMKSGTYRMTGIDPITKFDEDMIIIEKWNPNKPVSAVYFEPEKDGLYIKRFLLEENDKPVSFIADHPEARLEYISTAWRPQFLIKYDQRSEKREDETVDVEGFIAVKGLKALGNRLSKYKVKTIEDLDPLPYEEPIEESFEDNLDSFDESDEHEIDSTESYAETDEMSPKSSEVITENDEELTQAEADEERFDEAFSDESTAYEDDGSLAHDEADDSTIKDVRTSKESVKTPKPKKVIAPTDGQKDENALKKEEKNDKKSDGFSAGSQITLEL
jgi:hypothetical protein